MTTKKKEFKDTLRERKNDDPRLPGALQPGHSHARDEAIEAANELIKGIDPLRQPNNLEASREIDVDSHPDYRTTDVRRTGQVPQKNMSASEYTNHAANPHI